MNHPTRLLTYGFIVILMMMISLAVISYLYGNNSSSSVNLTITRHLEKTSLIDDLSVILHRQSHSTQSMLLGDDNPNNSQAMADNKLAAAYLETRDRLLLLLAPREKDILLKIDRLGQEIETLNRQVSALLPGGNRSEIDNILLQQILPKSNSLIALLSEISQSQPLELQKAMLTLGNDAEVNQTLLTLYAAFSVLVSLAVAILAVWYSQKVSSRLQDMNNYLEERVEERTESLLDIHKELLEDNTELTRLALTDNLTGLSNRTHINKLLQNEFSRYERHNHRFGIIMVDIDHFKEINDNYGHDVGDQVLIQLSRKFEQATRKSDHIARWGGEEFLICCTNVNEANLYLIAENIRKMVFNTVFEVVGSITISLGCALIEADESINELTKRADVALYAAKYDGRNQSVVSRFVDIM